jgi:hypothetical protein
VNSQSDTTLFSFSSLCRTWSDPPSGDGDELCYESTQTTTDDMIYHYGTFGMTTNVGSIA